MKYNWHVMNDAQKIVAVAEEMRLVTHNGTTKDDFVEIMKFLDSKLKLTEKALELACDNLFTVDEQEACPAEYFENVFPDCEECLGVEQPEVNILQCWKRYFIQEAGEAND